MTPPKDYHDKPLAEIQRMMSDVQARGGKAWIKWTCPTCHTRCIAIEPNQINLAGYEHDVCGTVYTEQRYGLMVMLPIGGKKL